MLIRVPGYASLNILVRRTFTEERLRLIFMVFVFVYCLLPPFLQASQEWRISAIRVTWMQHCRPCQTGVFLHSLYPHSWYKWSEWSLYCNLTLLQTLYLNSCFFFNRVYKIDNYLILSFQFCLFTSPPLTQFFLDCSGLVRTDKKPALCKSYQKLISELWHKKR